MEEMKGKASGGFDEDEDEDKQPGVFLPTTVEFISRVFGEMRYALWEKRGGIVLFVGLAIGKVGETWKDKAPRTSKKGVYKSRGRTRAAHGYYWNLKGVPRRYPAGGKE